MSTNTATAPQTSAKKELRYISFETFYKKYNDREDGFKYEWNNGIIEKTKSMKPDEFYILDLLNDFFYTNLKRVVRGMLITEGDTRTSSLQLRRPDMAYYNEIQKKLINKGVACIPEFVIEVISKNDSFIQVNHKVEEYFNAGVKVVWLISPDEQLVHVYNSINEVTICRDETLCSAEKAVKGFVLPASEIFKKED